MPDVLECKMSESESVESVALAHAVRRWDAEVENARRLATREGGILALILAILGLGLFRLGKLEPIEPPLLMMLVRGLLALSLILLVAALGRILFAGRLRFRSLRLRFGVPERDHEAAYASAALAWESAASGAGAAGRSRALAYARRLTTEAAGNLYHRNARRKQAIELGQRLIFYGALCVALAMLCYPLLAETALPPR